MQIKILASECAVNETYLATVEQLAKQLGLTYTIELVTDPAVHRQYQVFVGCLYGYCPGCNRLHAERQPDEHFTPALVINDTLELSSSFPEDEEIERCLLRHR